jgi:hypothetical protein
LNFDFGQVFIRAWEITWKYKVLWAINALPIAMTFLLLPIWLVIVFMQDLDPNRILGFAENPAFVIIGSVIYVLIIVGSVILQIISRASVTLGVFRAETEKQPITFLDLLRDGFRYFWRTLGVFALISVGVLVLFFAFFACMALFSAVTMGFGVICMQPLFLLMIPFSMLIMVLMEQAESAVVADESGVMDAIKRAYELIRSNIWRYILITLVIYFGMNILMSIILFPLMIPLFFIMLRSMENGMDFNNMLKMQAVFGIILVPVMALVQGIILTYLKSAMMVMYLRLTRQPNEPQPVAVQAVTA